MEEIHCDLVFSIYLQLVLEHTVLITHTFLFITCVLLFRNIIFFYPVSISLVLSPPKCLIVPELSSLCAY